MVSAWSQGDELPSEKIMARLLVVDDEPKALKLLEEYLCDQGHQVRACDSYETASLLLKHEAIDLMVTDVRLPGRSGIELLEFARSLHKDLPCVVITAYASVRDAVRTIRMGATDYLQKPFELEALSVVISKALDDASIRAEHEYLIRETREGETRPVLVGQSPAMRHVRRLIHKVAQTRSSVLILGETGTGKELVAQAIHEQSLTRHRPLIRVNCPGIPAELFESELFGHIKGAFTGATETRKGCFELANRGSIFLDEIAEIPSKLQAKLLRVLEERRIVRVGGSNEILIDLRVIAATNRDLEAMVRQGRFREDLYYRLNVFPIHMPPLKECMEDIEALSLHLLDHLACQCSTTHHGLCNSAIDALFAYSWPGNARELRNVLERALILSGGGKICVEHLLLDCRCGAHAAPVGEAATLRDKVKHYKIQLILAELRRKGWRKKLAAERLGLSQRALSHYIGKYDLEAFRAR